MCLLRADWCDTEACEDTIFLEWLLRAKQVHTIVECFGLEGNF